MYAVLLAVILLLVPCSIVEVVCIRNAIRDRSDIPSSILFGFFEILLIAGLVMTLSEWNTQSRQDLSMLMEKSSTSRLNGTALTTATNVSQKRVDRKIPPFRVD